MLIQNGLMSNTFTLPAILRGIGKVTFLLFFMFWVQTGFAQQRQQTTTQSQTDPDMPDFARYKLNKEEFMKLRSEAVNKMRGIVKDQPFDPAKRAIAIREMEAKESQLRSSSSSLIADPWVAIGPFPIPNGQTQTVSTPVSGRVISIAIHPTNSNIVYAGTAQGGLYRTINGGTSWTPIMDNALSLAIGSIAIDPSNPETVWVGTGEPNFSADSYFGVGLYRISNASTTATLSGPFNLDVGAADVFSGRAIGRVIVHPTNPDILFVSSTSGIGGIRPANNQFPSRGIYRCVNATSGAPVFAKLTGLLADLNVSVHDVAIDPNDPNILVAIPIATGASRGVYIESTNALNADPTTVTFTQRVITNSSSTSTLNGELTVVHPVGDVNATFYAALGVSNGRVMRSTDGGVTWTTQITNGFCGTQCFYDIAIAVDPSNVNTVYLGGNPAIIAAKSINGGTTFTDNNLGLHVDTHALTVSPSNTNIVWLGTDGGIYKSTDAGLTWTHQNTGEFSATQFMSIDVHPTDPNFSIGGTQDNGTNWYQPAGTWTRTDFGDGGNAVIDQNAADNVNVRMYHTYFSAGSPNFLMGYSTVSTTVGAFENWAFRGCNGAAGNGIACTGVVNFYAPLERGPGNPNTIYYGTDRLYRSADNGTNHTVVSQAPIASGVPISCIGISPQNDNIRIVGLNDGKIYGTITGSTTLDNVDNSGQIPDVAIARTIIDPLVTTTAWVTLSAFNVSPVWKSTNFGGIATTWTAASTGLPQIPVNAIVVDPANSNNVYVGTDIGVYVSTDGGATWNPFGTGLPRVAVFDMAITALPAKKLRIATHGRGMWENTLVAPVVAAGCSDLFISEYVEGSSNNKAIEIYNPTATPVTLTGNYQIRIYNNGAVTPNTTTALTGVVPANGVFVISHTSANATILGIANQTSGNISFNGNDAVELYKNVTTTTLDVIGQIGNDPGAGGWTGGGLATTDRTLRRKFVIDHGDPIGNNAFDPSIEWDGYVQDDVADLGAHTSGLAEINVQGNAINIVDGDATPTTTDHTDFGNQSVCTGTVVRTYTIQNTGTANLNIPTAGITVTGGDAGMFVVGGITLPATIAPLGSTTFTVTFDPSSTGPKTTMVNIVSNDCDENPYDFTIQGTGIDPEVNIQGNGITIVDGDNTPSLADHTDFGSQSVCSGTITRIFTIQNTGNSNLTWTILALGGPDLSEFGLTGAPGNPILPGGSTTFSVIFNPTSAGVKNATITFNSNDCDKATYDFAIRGTGVDPEIDIRGNSVSITDGDVTPVLADHTDFGTIQVARSICPHIYYS